MDKRAILLLGAFLVAFVIISSFLLAEVARLNAELSALKRQSGEYSYNSDWVTKFVGYNPIASAGEAKEELKKTRSYLTINMRSLSKNHDWKTVK